MHIREMTAVRAVMNTVLNHRVSLNAGNFLAVWGAIGSWWTTVLRGVSQRVDTPS